MSVVVQFQPPKVGDTVKLVRRAVHHHELAVGDVGIVREVHPKWLWSHTVFFYRIGREERLTPDRLKTLTEFT